MIWMLQNLHPTWGFNSCMQTNRIKNSPSKGKKNDRKFSCPFSPLNISRIFTRNKFFLCALPPEGFKFIGETDRQFCLPSSLTSVIQGNTFPLAVSGQRKSVSVIFHHIGLLLLLILGEQWSSKKKFFNYLRALPIN